MKKLSSTLVFGVILLYFIDIALRIEPLDIEMLTHNLVRFFSGFVFLGILVWHNQKLKFKFAMYCILIFLISDDIYDYLRTINNLRLEMLLHDLYLVVWGAISGFFFMRYLYKKIPTDYD